MNGKKWSYDMLVLAYTVVMEILEMLETMYNDYTP